MPLPKPKKDEKEKTFISRCVPLVIKSEELNKDDEDDRNQAVAMCYSQWRKAKGGKSMGKVDSKAIELRQRINQIEDAWRAEFEKPSVPGGEKPWHHIRVFEDPEVATVDLPAGLFAYPYTLGEDGYEFSDPYEAEFKLQRKEGKAFNNVLKAVSKTDDELRVANYIFLFNARDLEGIGSRKVNKDGSRGEYFTAVTDYKSAYTETGRLLVDWEHGLDKDGGDDVPAPGRDDVLGYVDWKTARADERGLWVERVLSRRNAYMQFLETLFDEELIGNSSEAVPGKVKVADNGAILTWPLKRDTLTVSPMDWRMMVNNPFVIQAVKGLAECNSAFKSALSITLRESLGFSVDDALKGGDGSGDPCLEAAEAIAKSQLLLIEIEQEA